MIVFEKAEIVRRVALGEGQSEAMANLFKITFLKGAEAAFELASRSNLEPSTLGVLAESCQAEMNRTRSK